MKSRPLTMTIKKTICAKVLEKQFQKKIDKAKERVRIYGDDIYNLCYPQEYQRLMQQLPNGAFSRDVGFFIKIPFYSKRIIMTESRPHFRYLPVSSFTGKETQVKKYLAEEDKIDALRKERSIIRQKIMSVLNSNTTTLKLVQAWPEVEPYLVDALGKPKETQNLPAFPVGELNKILGLKK